MPTRRQLLATLAATSTAWALGTRRLLDASTTTTKGGRMDPTPDPTRGSAPKPARMPVLFVGHGSPMNTLDENEWSLGFAALAHQTPRPKAILAISAHWFVDGTHLTGDVRPRTIHDFSGFPRALYALDYPAAGRPDLAEQVRTLLGERASVRQDWGLDHGTCSVLRWMYPDADVPVVQLSIDRRLGMRRHFELARSLADLRDQGVLILASGNTVHNLADAIRHMRTGSTDTPTWAKRFDDRLAEVLTQRDTAALLSTWPDGADARKAHPTPDHWLPLIYAYAATDERDTVRFPVEGFDLGSVGMRSVRFGP